MEARVWLKAPVLAAWIYIDKKKSHATLTSLGRTFQLCDSCGLENSSICYTPSQCALEIGTQGCRRGHCALETDAQGSLGGHCALAVAAQGPKEPSRPLGTRHGCHRLFFEATVCLKWLPQGAFDVTAHSKWLPQGAFQRSSETK